MMLVMHTIPSTTTNVLLILITIVKFVLYFGSSCSSWFFFSFDNIVETGIHVDRCYQLLNPQD